LGEGVVETADAPIELKKLLFARLNESICHNQNLLERLQRENKILRELRRLELLEDTVPRQRHSPMSNWNCCSPDLFKEEAGTIVSKQNRLF
jgi:hypothetical protein